MKRVYEKPSMIAERFTPNQTIAACISTQVQNGYIEDLPFDVWCSVGSQHAYSGSCYVKNMGNGTAYVYWKDTSTIGDIRATDDQKYIIETVLGQSGGGWHYALVNFDARYDTVYTGNTASSV